MPKPPLRLQTTTLWDYPSQQYRREQEASRDYRGATPAYVVWNVLSRYTRKNDLVVDPMCGSGTAIDVARDLGRRALGYDLAPVRDDIHRADARKIPLESGKADFVFVDPPYSTHIRYSGLPECLGELSADSGAYFEAMRLVIGEIDRVLSPERYMALYICDSYRKGEPLMPIGFRVFGILSERFTPVDIVAVTRRNKTLLRRHWRQAAIEHNYFLRGFNYLFVMYKSADARVKGAAGARSVRRGGGGAPERREKFRLPDRRPTEEVEAHLKALSGGERR